MVDQKIINKYTIPVYDDFTLFICEISQTLKRLGDRSFLEYSPYLLNLENLMLQNKDKHVLFYIATVEYIARLLKEDVPEVFRKNTFSKLDKLTFSEGVELFYQATGDSSLMERELKNAIPEYLKYNLVVSNVRFAV